MDFKKFFKSRIIFNVIQLMGGTAIAQLLGAISLPIITRLYSPDEFGLLSVFLSFFSFGVVVLTLRYESALLNSVELSETFKLFYICRFLVFFTSLIVSIGLVVLIHHQVLGFEVLPYWSVIIAFLSFMTFGVFMINRAVLLRFGELTIISKGVVGRTVSNVGSKIVLGLFNVSSIGLLFGELLGSITAMFVTRKARSRFHYQRHLASSEPTHTQNYLSVAVKYRRFPLLELPSSLINQLTLSLPIVFAADLFGAKAAGILGLSRTLYAIPNTQIGGAIADVFQMELSKCLRHERQPEDALRLLFKFSKFLASIAFLSLLSGIYLVPTLAGPIFGDSWLEVGYTIALMAPWMASSLVASSLGRALLIFERQDLKLVYDLFSLLIVIFSYIITTQLNENLLYFVKVLSFGMFGSYIIYYLLIYYVVHRYAGEN